MTRRPPPSTLFPYTDALPISGTHPFESRMRFASVVSNGSGACFTGSCSSAKIGEYGDRKSTRLNSSHSQISYAVFCLKKKTHAQPTRRKSQERFGLMHR